MITNLINYLYDIDVDYIRKSKSGYIFFYNNSFYIFKEYYGNKDYLKQIIKLLSKDNLLYHEIIKNKDNNFFSFYNGVIYILLKIKFNINRRILINDLLSNNHSVDIVPKKDFLWLKLWSEKIDQVEYYVFNNLEKFNIYVISIINYFLSLSELALNICNYIKMEYIPLTLCHKRINFEADLYEYYCIDNLIIDHYTRDVGEYIKSYIYNNDGGDFAKYIKNMTYDDRCLLLSRILFPSYFFDLFDEYILNKKDFSNFDVNFIYLSELNDSINSYLKTFSK